MQLQDRLMREVDAREVDMDATGGRCQANTQTRDLRRSVSFVQTGRHDSAACGVPR